MASCLPRSISYRKYVDFVAQIMLKEGVANLMQNDSFSGVGLIAKKDAFREDMSAKVNTVIEFSPETKVFPEGFICFPCSCRPDSPLHVNKVLKNPVNELCWGVLETAAISNLGGGVLTCAVTEDGVPHLWINDGVDSENIFRRVVKFNFKLHDIPKEQLQKVLGYFNHGLYQPTPKHHSTRFNPSEN